MDWYYKEKLYIPNVPGLRHDVVKQCHDAITVGHPGQWDTIEAVTQFYWWPGMKEFFTKYTDSCDLCQCMKAATYPKATLQPNEIPEGPWQTVGIDFIVKLLKSNGYDSIAVLWNNQSCPIYFLYFLFFLSVLYFLYSFTPSIDIFMGIFIGISDIQRLSSLPGPYHHQPQRSTAYYRPA